MWYLFNNADITLDRQTRYLVYNSYLKSKSIENCSFSLWNTGSWAVAWALLARDSDAADEKVLDTLEADSNPIPNVLTNFFTKLDVWGVTRAAATVWKRKETITKKFPPSLNIRILIFFLWQGTLYVEWKSPFLATYYCVTYEFSNFKSNYQIMINNIIVSIKFYIVIGSPGAYLSRNWRVITWVSNYRCPIWNFCNWIPTWFSRQFRALWWLSSHCFYSFLNLGKVLQTFSLKRSF